MSLAVGLLERALQAGKLRCRGTAPELVEDGAQDPVGLVAFALGRRVEVLDRAEETGYEVLVSETLGETVHPEGHLGLGGRAAQERLVVGADAIPLAFAAGSEAECHRVCRHAALELVPP